MTIKKRILAPAGILFLFMLILSLNMNAQGAFKSFKRLGGPEKKWVLTHPFIAKKSWEASRLVLSVTDSLYTNKVLAGPLNGGEIDAFRHCFWLAVLSSEIGPERALRLARAHERTNFRNYQHAQKEEEYIPDRICSEMDYWNNSRGVEIWAKAPDADPAEWTKLTLSWLREGVLRTIQMDGEGNFTDCSGKVIPRAEWEGKWLNERCLVPTGSGN